ncbi:hypothetical protein V6N11_013291 [Hibiscus sabdariffa]|uniref:Uncharacterized protein n=1 Tax=Hibiscus sabdariffa TaxID=183260 RepID=A0ABR2NND9_9ROSI
MLPLFSFSEILWSMREIDTLAKPVFPNVNVYCSRYIIENTFIILAYDVEWRTTLLSWQSYFAKTRQDMVSTIGAPAARALLDKALYFLSVGSNDIMFGEYSFDANKYVDEVVSDFKSQLTVNFFPLSNYDFNTNSKIVVSGVPKVGCFPFDVDTHLWVHDCVASLNKIAELYNAKLKSLLEDLTKSLTGSIFVYVANYAIMEDIMNNYASYGEIQR